MNLFEIATRNKYRFPSSRGSLTVEQLWDLPLTGNTAFDLDTVARAVNAELKNIAEGSFVETDPDPRKTRLEQMLEVVKHIISVKLKEREQAEAARSRAEKRHKLLDVLASKEEQELQQLSKDEILKQLEALD